jgi:voltage-dependent calcium channel L type alpha-1D
MGLKLIGLGRTYFFDTWNKFDMFVVIASDLGFILNAMDISDTVSRTITVVRSVRVMRMVRLVKTSVNIRLIFDTIMNILPQITNVMTLIILLLYIFAALSINIFSSVMVP